MKLLSGSPLALTRFAAMSPPANQSSTMVVVEGRRPGIGGYVLAAIGIDATTSLVISTRDITFQSGSLFGQLSSVMPLTAVASIHAGYAKPLRYLALALGCAVCGAFSMLSGWANDAGGWVAAAVVLLLIASASMFMYALNKRFALFIESSGGATLGLVFKPSMIEGVQVDEQRVQQIVTLTRELIIAAQRGG